MRSSMVRASLYGLAVLALVSGMVAHPAAGAVTAAPEIDGSVMTASFAALSAGILILRSRRRVR